MAKYISAGILYCKATYTKRLEWKWQSTRKQCLIDFFSQIHLKPCICPLNVVFKSIIQLFSKRGLVLLENSWHFWQLPKGEKNLFKLEFFLKMPFYSQHTATDTKILTSKESLLCWQENYNYSSELVNRTSSLCPYIPLKFMAHI